MERMPWASDLSDVVCKPGAGPVFCASGCPSDKLQIQPYAPCVGVADPSLAACSVDAVDVAMFHLSMKSKGSVDSVTLRRSSDSHLASVFIYDVKDVG